MQNVFTNILECVGRTPTVKLNRLGADLGHDFYVKLELMNPGSSVKDRIALQMVADAEESGRLKAGGTIIECTSGNTGMGLALVGAVKGYPCIFVMPDKVSNEKIKALRAFGARVVTTPTAVEPDDPRSYYSVARRLAQEIPGSFLADQYRNPSNPEAHYRMTGPEIWEQMEGKIDYFVATAGTGGTISGVARFLKEKNPAVRVIGVDPEGSIFYEYFKTGKAPKLLTTYKVEGFGEDFLPDTLNFGILDDMVRVSDRECFLTARELTKQEGLFVGGSCGGAVAAAFKVAKSVRGRKTFLVLLPDSGSRYLSKFYDDDWMRENGFLEFRADLASVRDLLADRYGKVITAAPRDKVRDVVARMKKHSISQLPVVEKGRLAGLITEVGLLGAMTDGAAGGEDPIEAYVERELEEVAPDARIDELASAFKSGRIAVVVEQAKVVGIVTKIDLVDFLTGRGRR